MYDPRHSVIIKYKNHRGEVSERVIIPLSLAFATSEWHPEKQWLLTAYDMNKDADRTFAMCNILEWWAYGTNQHT